MCSILDAFREYDYGAIENYVKYGSTSPPVYNVSTITAPVAVYYASNDYFAGVTVSFFGILYIVC